MFSTFLVVLPVFALILAGWLVRRIGVMGKHAVAELNRFVVYLGLPALLFDIIAHASLEEIWRPGFIAAFGLSSGLIFAVTIFIRMKRSLPLADAAIDGLNTGYANTGFVGFPLALVALGQDAMTLTLIASIITVCVIFGAAIVLIEIGLQTETSRTSLFLKVGGSLARNPLIVAPAIGALFPILDLPLPTPLETFVHLLGGAASPCALVALGLFLAEKRKPARNTGGTTAFLVTMKLIIHPVLTWVLAALVFQLPPIQTHTAVLLAALPTGTGSFMLAELYSREGDVTSRTILISTVISILTVSAYLALIG